MMTINQALELHKDHQRTTLKARTRESYRLLLEHFRKSFSDRDVDSVKAEEILQFLETGTGKLARSTRHLRYSQLKAFFSFALDLAGSNIQNPCNSSLVSKAFKASTRLQRKILDKETVDELIFNSSNLRDRLILELQARCGLRIGEVLGLKVSDVSTRKLLIREPKSGKEAEVAFMPEHIAQRMGDYIATLHLSPEDRLFRVCYTTARNLVHKLGARLNLKISPHDLRRHSATYASRNGVPLEIISKVILRHQDLKTTQIYLGKVTDAEAIRWMDNLHEK